MIRWTGHTARTVAIRNVHKFTWKANKKETTLEKDLNAKITQ
jgi:hypothetical protein